MSLWLSIALQAATVDPSISTFDLAQSAKQLTLTSLPACNGDDAHNEEIVVCGRRPDRYRLPLPAEHVRQPGPVRGEAPSAMAALTPSGRCGIFAGERRCNKREAAKYGYGNGRNPITLLSRLAEKVVDPDSD
jgi:hypothetical protein